MYWTNFLGGVITKALMDGTNSVEIVSGLRYPVGIIAD